LRAFSKRRRVRIAAIGLAVFIAGLEWGAVIFHVSCRDGPHAVPAYGPDQVKAFAAEFPDYKRPQESMYLTLPEWYEVFSYQEYARSIAHDRPSRFSYFAAIGQFWGMYCHAYAATEGSYPFNAGDHLVIGVIGVSFTAEYAVKGLYENTIGRLYEFSSHTTPEDAYAAQTAGDYGTFVETRPWYEYHFGARAVGIWTEPDFFGPHFLRKCERKIFLTYEYGIKAVYGAIIQGATKTIFGPPPAKDYLWVENLSQEQRTSVHGLEVVRDLGDGSSLIVLPHYQGFTDAVPILAKGGVRFLDVAGNDRIVMTVVASDAWTYDLPDGHVVFSQPVLTAPHDRRLVIEAPVRHLHELLPTLEREGVRIEHLFDY
jgi:hypothetical protein